MKEWITNEDPKIKFSLDLFNKDDVSANLLNEMIDRIESIVNEYNVEIESLSHSERFGDYLQNLP